MEYSALESNTKVVEKDPTREELQNILSALEQELKQVKKRASEFYDLALCDLYKEARIHFMGNEEGIRLALQAEGKDYEKVKTNVQAAKDFEETYISPITDQILNLKKQIRILDNKKFEEEEQNQKKEALEKFAQNKEIFESMLYEMLDKLYAEIPKELKDSGIQDDKALEMHDSNLHYAAMQVQSYISQIEETPQYDFEKVKRYIESSLERSSTLKKYTTAEKETSFFDKNVNELNISLNLINIFNTLQIKTIGELKRKYTPQELLGYQRWNKKATDEINALFKENNQPPYIV